MHCLKLLGEGIMAIIDFDRQITEIKARAIGAIVLNTFTNLATPTPQCLV